MADENANPEASQGNMFFIRGHIILGGRGGRGSGTGAARRLIEKELEAWGPESYPTHEEARIALRIWTERDVRTGWVVRARSDVERLELEPAVDEWSRRGVEEDLLQKARRDAERADREYWFWRDWDGWLGYWVKLSASATVVIFGVVIVVAWLL